MKTNDVTGRFKRGYAGLAIEFGRPALGARLNDVEKVTKALAPMGVKWEKENPATFLIKNQTTGDLKEDVETCGRCDRKFCDDCSGYDDIPYRTSEDYCSDCGADFQSLWGDFTCGREIHMEAVGKAAEEQSDDQKS